MLLVIIFKIQLNINEKIPEKLLSLLHYKNLKIFFHLFSISGWKVIVTFSEKLTI